MLIWISLIAAVWIAALVVIVAACRAAAMGDLAQAQLHVVDRRARFGRSGVKLLPRRRSHA